MQTAKWGRSACRFCEALRSPATQHARAFSSSHNLSRSERLFEAYILLNLRGDEDLAKVKRQYHVQAVRWHPDRAGGSKERFQRITAAYEFIRDHRLGGYSAHEREPARQRPWPAEPRPHSSAGRQSQRDGWWGDHEEDHEPPPDFKQGPRTTEGRWIWKVALGFIAARILLLCGMKVAYGDNPEGAAVRVNVDTLQATVATRGSGVAQAARFADAER